MASEGGQLIAFIGENDTATGLLLTGIGHVDVRKNSNFLIVDDSELISQSQSSILPPPPTLFLLTLPITFSLSITETTQQQIEDSFKEFTTREDIAILLINQHIANTIRHLLDAYSRPVPAILEIPSKDQPYDPNQDSVLAKVKFLFGEG
jgi:V-type H+-transporting ATPase subunit F